MVGCHGGDHATGSASFGCIIYLVSTGVGVWGNNVPVGWAWDITNFVLDRYWSRRNTDFRDPLLTRQKWRTSINRAAEAMPVRSFARRFTRAFTLAGCLMAWFMAPVPNSNGIWPNFRSPLLWDVFAVGTYFTVSVLFWYTGLIPDIATLRDRAKTKIRKFAYGILALGWRGSNRHWRHYEMAYLSSAGLSTPLVLSVHSVVSFDFATSVIPAGTRRFSRRISAGAIFGGFAMVLTIMIPGFRAL